MPFSRKFAVALAIVVLPLLVSVMPVQATIWDHSSPQEVENQFVNDINDLRHSHGLAPLVVNSRLTDLSRTHSAAMARSGGLSHNLRLITGDVPSSWTKLGQNVGYGGSESSLQDAFVASRSHYVNLIDEKFTSVGVGVVERNGRIWVTENFMR